MHLQSRCQREPVRYQWGTYDSMLNEWMQSINLGGTAEVLILSFCPFWGQKLFLFILSKGGRKNVSKLQRSKTI